MGVKGLKYPSLQSDNRADCVIFNQVWLTSRVLLRQSGWHSPSSLVSRINHGSMSCGHSASVTCLSLFLNKHELLIRIVRPRSAAFLWILWIFMQLRLSLSLSLSLSLFVDRTIVQDRREIDAGVDGLKRLRLTPKLFDWLVDGDASQCFRRQLRRSKFKKFPVVKPLICDLVDSSENGRKASPLTKSCIRHYIDCLFAVFEVI